MSLTLKYSDPRGLEEPAVLVSLGSNVRFGDLGLALSAELGEAAVSTVEIDDPGGIYTFAGLRAFDVRETSAASNNQMIGRFAIQDREVHRNPDRAFVTGADRSWSVDLTDYNWHLGKRILVDADAKRPIETAGDRIRWLLNNAAHISLNDYGHVTYPTAQLDATDYRGQRANDVLADCCVEDQYNFWCDFNEAHGKPELFFINPNNAADTYAASITISNVLSDVDNVLTFAPYEDGTLKRSPTRIAYGVYLPYANGAVYVRKDSTGDQFGLQDQAAPMSNVKTATRATRVATVFLNKNDSETDRIKCSIKVPAAQVNDVRHGQLIQVRFSHLPGYETAQIVRVLQKTVTQEEEGGQGYYRIGLEMQPLDPPVTAGGTGTGTTYTGSAFAGCQLSDGNLGTLVWDYTGDAQAPGFNVNPTVGPLSQVGSPFAYTKLTTSVAITVRVSAKAGFAAVFSAGGDALMTCTSSVNGIIATGALGAAPGGGFASGDCTIELASYAMAAGEVLTFTGSYHGLLGGGGWGQAGNNNTYIRIGRGTHNWGSGGSAETWVGPS